MVKTYVRNEKVNENIIGLVGFKNFTPLDTIFSTQENVELSINIKPFIIQGGLHSFALGGVDSSDNNILIFQYIYYKKSYLIFYNVP